MNNEIVINIGSSGQVKGMHRDEFNLGFLGAQRITRASDIRFDEKAQNWRIWLAEEPSEKKYAIGGYTVGDGEFEIDFTDVREVGAFPTYNAARDFEVLWLNECMKAGISALDPKGVMLGAFLYDIQV